MLENALINKSSHWLHKAMWQFYAEDDMLLLGTINSPCGIQMHL